MRIGLFNVLIVSLIVLPSGAPVFPSELRTVSAVAPTPSQTYTLTAYTADCLGCSGVTYTGVDVSNTIYHAGHRIIAVDPKKIPLGSTVAIEFDSGRKVVATAEDTGGAINGKHIDLLVKNYGRAIQIGRQSVTVEIITEGKR